MKPAILFLSLLLLLLIPVDGARAAEPYSDYEEPYTGSVLCMAGAYRIEPGECLPLGPSIPLKMLADLGVHLPIESLSIERPAYDLTYVPYLYGQVVTRNAPVYASKEDAARGRPVLYKLEGIFNYISYTYTEVFEEMRVYEIAPGQWMTANDVHRIGTPTYQGILLLEPPRQAFGWILQPTETKHTPTFATLDYTGRQVTRFQIFPALASKTVDGTEWVMIALNEWIEKRFIGRVTPRAAPPEGVTATRWIDINLYEQTVAVYENNRLIFATLTSSGIDPFWTRPGLFQIYQKLPSTEMHGTFEADRSDYYYLEDVPWTMYFDEARALHGAYWHTGYGYPRSHGCVNLSPGDARWLFDWAQEGDWVYVWDPSGQTPTDPSLYGSGGA